MPNTAPVAPGAKSSRASRRFTGSDSPISPRSPVIVECHEWFIRNVPQQMLQPIAAAGGGAAGRHLHF